MLPAGDDSLVQIVDAATANAAGRSGHWLKCRPACTQCCVGVFPITQLDAHRLRAGLAELETAHPPRAAAIRSRAQESVERLKADFPGDSVTGRLNEDHPGFEGFANDEPCPATGLCDLYSARPMTCRVFGPPVRTEDGIGVCELCFVGADESEILAAELDTDWASLEDAVNSEAEQQSGRTGTTTVAFAVLA
jgi:Fe-S-cluster containining protein